MGIIGGNVGEEEVVVVLKELSNLFLLKVEWGWVILKEGKFYWFC